MEDGRGGIAEDGDDSRPRAESRKAIRIPQPARAGWSSHAPIMPDFCTASPVFPPAAGAGFRVLSPLFHPLVPTKTRKWFLFYSHSSPSAGGPDLAKRQHRDPWPRLESIMMADVRGAL